MLVKFRYQENPLEAVALDPDMIVAADAGQGPGTEILLKNGLTYKVVESVDEVVAAVKVGAIAAVKAADGASPKGDA